MLTRLPHSSSFCHAGTEIPVGHGLLEGRGRCPPVLGRRAEAASGSPPQPSKAAACQSFIIIFLQRTFLQDAHQPRVPHFAARLPRSLARSLVVALAPCRGALLANFSPSAFQPVETDSSDGVKQRDEDRRGGNGRRVERGHVGQRADNTTIACSRAGCRVFLGAIHCGSPLGDGGGFLRQPCAMLSMPKG